MVLSYDMAVTKSWRNCNKSMNFVPHSSGVAVATPPYAGAEKCKGEERPRGQQKMVKTCPVASGSAGSGCS